MWTQWMMFDGAVVVRDTSPFFNKLDLLGDIKDNYENIKIDEFRCELLEGKTYG